MVLELDYNWTKRDKMKRNLNSKYCMWLVKLALNVWFLHKYWSWDHQTWHPSSQTQTRVSLLGNCMVTLTKVKYNKYSGGWEMGDLELKFKVWKVKLCTIVPFISKPKMSVCSGYLLEMARWVWQADVYMHHRKPVYCWWVIIGAFTFRSSCIIILTTIGIHTLWTGREIKVAPD